MLSPPDVSQRRLTVSHTKAKTMLRFAFPLHEREADGKSSPRNRKRKSVPVLVALPHVFYKTQEYSTNLVSRICCSTYVSCIYLYYFKKCTNLPISSGLTSPYQISLKTKYFIFISIFSLFLPKLSEPAGTSRGMPDSKKKTRKCYNFWKFTKPRKSSTWILWGPHFCQRFTLEVLSLMGSLILLPYLYCHGKLQMNYVQESSISAF